MFCDAKGCNEIAKYLRVIEIDKDCRIKFNLCEEYNKLKWEIRDSKQIKNSN